MLIAGCGQKGPLYRPAPEAAPASEAETAGTGSERDDSGER
ncbi:MAG: lipoprotein [Marinobacter sp.]|nr:lipoprotein [Marinobacter sp.]MDX1633197.1 lipoprotein [Marinobacter sp.]